MKIIKRVQSVVRGTTRAFMMPMMENTRLVPIEMRNSKGHVVSFELVHEDRNVMTRRVQI